MTTFKEYIVGLKTEMNMKGIRQNELSVKTGLSNTTISQTLSLKSMSIKGLLKIEEAIQEWN